MLRGTLMLLTLGLLSSAAIFTIESIKEQEWCAARIGTGGILLTILLGILLTLLPDFHWAVGLFYAVLILFFLLCMAPGRVNPQAMGGTRGYIRGQVQRVDERDTVFARNRSLMPGSAVYKKYYAIHPEKEERDAERRAAGPPLGRPGSIDGEHRPNVSMFRATFNLPLAFGQREQVEPQRGSVPFPMDASEATDRIKGFAKHLGADLVGICHLERLWAYSHRGEIFYNNWDEWGQPIPDPLPFAIVIATEMKSELVRGAPHTPSVVESGLNYARGAYITSILASFIAQLGYPAVAHHLRHYDLVLVPVAIDAGLGELGRFGYLITKEFGPRIRLAAVTTSLPLIPDKPVDLGVQEFCARCFKCARTCPSGSIPEGEKVVHNGVEKWKLEEESCFAHWAKIGTDCNICMAICPYSRPNWSFHRLARWMVHRSPLARAVFPWIDNMVYGRKWHSGKVSSWVDYRAPEESA